MPEHFQHKQSASIKFLFLKRIAWKMNKNISFNKIIKILEVK